MTRQKIASVIFFIMPLFFAWILAGQIILSRMTIDNLVKVTGVIDHTKEEVTKVKKRLFYTRVDVELRIYLKDNPEYFRVMEVYKYQRFRERINDGDTAEIYIRPGWLIPLSMGYRNDVFQMSVNGQTIFGISETRRNSNGIIIVSLIAIPLFIFLGKWTRRKAREKEKLRADKKLQYERGAK